MRWRVLALLLLLLPTGVHADEWEVYPEQGVQTFLGLDDTSAPTQVQDGRAQDLQNVVLDVSKGLQKRFGYDQIGTNTLDLPGEDWCATTGVYYAKFSSGTERIVATCGHRFYYLDGTTWTRQGVSAAITGGQNNQFVFTTALDNIIATNDVNAPIQWTGATTSNVTTVSFSGLSASETPSTAKSVAFFKNYLIFANTVEQSVERPTRLRYSNVGTINTWTDGDYIDIGALAGQEIVALAELYDNLYVFLTDSIYKVSLVGGDDVFNVSKVTDDIGCIAKNSVQSITLLNAQNGLVFLDKDKKVYFFNGVIAQDISQLITTTMGGLSGSRLQYAVSADTNTDYLLCVTSGTGSTNNLCLDLQYQLGEWTKQQNLPANAMAHVLDSNSTDQVYWGSYRSFLYQYQDEDLVNDVAGFSGTVSTVDVDTIGTVSSAQALYNPAWNLTTGALAGAPIELVGGTGAGQTNTVADNTNTGIIVVAAFSTTPTSSTTFEVGAIDSFYTTKWYDFGNSAQLKHFGEVYFWAEADVSSTHSLSYATDFNADITTEAVRLSANTSDAIWGSAIWGVALWGSVDTIFRPTKLTGSGRYLRYKWAEDDIDETFRIHGYNTLMQRGDVN